MKNSKSVIPLKLRSEMEADPFYKVCVLSGWVLFGKLHECEGSITWEHSLIHAGEKIQKKWAIIQLCEKGHAVNRFQDAGTMKKELSEWVAYSRATDDDILDLEPNDRGFHPDFRKTKDKAQRKRYLIGKYGVWKPMTSMVQAPPVPQPQSMNDVLVSIMGSGDGNIHHEKIPKGALVLLLPPDLLADINIVLEMGRQKIPGYKDLPVDFILQAIVTRIQAAKISLESGIFDPPNNPPPAQTS